MRVRCTSLNDHLHLFREVHRANNQSQFNPTEPQRLPRRGLDEEDRIENAPQDKPNPGRLG